MMAKNAATMEDAEPDTLDFRQILDADAANAELRKTDRTRARLLAGLADELAASVGRSELKVATVTAKAGTAHGTFYRYFPDIRAATESLIEAFAAFVGDKLTAVREGEAGSRQRVRGATLAYTRLFRRNAALMKCLLGIGGDSPAFARLYQDLNRQWYTRVASAIARHRAKTSGIGVASPAEFVPTAYALGGMIDEFLTQVYLRCDPALAELVDDEERIADLLSDLWYRGAYGSLPDPGT